MTVAFPPASRIQPVPARSMDLVRPLRIGVVTPHNPHDKTSFSGTVHYAVGALSKRPELDIRVLGPHRPVGRFDRVLRRGPARFDPATLDQASFDGLDVVLGLTASAFMARAIEVTDLPLVHVTDATPCFLREVYGRNKPLSDDIREAKILNRATTVYSSRFMAQRALAKFGAIAADAQHLKFGVNFADLPSGLPEKRSLDRLELLFVGGDWTRKGGRRALAAFDALRATGRDAHLTLVGSVPEPFKANLKTRRDITITGFLDKNRPRDAAQLATLYARAHLFILPTLADCTPMVLAEAMAHHTPVIATDVGGISEMIGQGAGRVLAATASAADWAATITDMTEDPSAYSFLCDGAHDRVAEHLNWDVWAEGLAAIAAETILEKAARAA